MATLMSAGAPARAGSPATSIRWPFRAWMVVEVVFGLLATGALFLNPGNTERDFAWPIQPVVMAALLGAFYFAAAPLFALALFARTWQQVRALVIPAALFCLVMDLATVLHWDKFSLGTAPFYVWLASYVLPPPILGALYWWHQRDSAPVGAGVEAPLPGWSRALLRANGLAQAGLAALLFAAPSLLQQVAPWNVTPLTARTLCGWLFGVGLLQAWMGWENDWRRVRLASVMLILLPLAIVFQLARFVEQVNWTSAALWVLVLDTAAVAAAMVWLWLAFSRREG
ncbi:MAG TPA: hypothetical protein VNL77_16115 [Roseiflexaceae bacterium]|nr:hypothetical protein [Roseiflexaceae bacterium]